MSRRPELTTGRPGRPGRPGHPGRTAGRLLVLGGAALAVSGAAALLVSVAWSVPGRSGAVDPVRTVASGSLPSSTLPSSTLPSGAPTGGPEPARFMYATEGKQVPLPPGDWLVMRRAVTASGPRNGAGARAPVVSTALLRLRGHRVDAAMLVQVNQADAPSDWGLAGGCTREDFYHAAIRYASDHDAACSYVATVTPWSASAPSIDAAWRTAMQLAVDNGWAVPRHWLEAVYRVTDPMDALQVRYLFDPSPGEAAEEIGGGQVAALVAWSEASWPGVQRGFRARLAPAEGDALAEWRAMRGGPSPPSAHSALAAADLQRTTLKTASYRLFGSLTDFSVAYVVLGSAAAAGTLSLAGAVASSVLYFAHELAWSYVPAPDAPRALDLPGTGLEQPGPALPAWFDADAGVAALGSRGAAIAGDRR